MTLELTKNRCLCSIIFLLSTFLSCKNEDFHCKLESYSFIKSYEPEAFFPKLDRLVVFYLCDSLLENDTIDMSFFDYSHHDIDDCYISFQLSPNFKIEKVERKTKYCATVWSDRENVQQYLKFKQFSYEKKRELPFFNPKKYKQEIYSDVSLENKERLIEYHESFQIFLNSKNVIYYPTIQTTDFIKNKFSNIKKDQLILAVKSELDKNSIYSNAEKQIWMSYVNQFRDGDFNLYNNMFSFDYFEVYIILSLESKGKEIIKVLKYDIAVGN